MVIAAGPLSEAQLAEVRAFHAELPHREGYWDRHLEGTWAPDALADFSRRPGLVETRTIHGQIFAGEPPTR